MRQIYPHISNGISEYLERIYTNKIASKIEGKSSIPEPIYGKHGMYGGRQYTIKSIISNTYVDFIQIYSYQALITNIFISKDTMVVFIDNTYHSVTTAKHQSDIFNTFIPELSNHEFVICYNGTHEYFNSLITKVTKARKKETHDNYVHQLSDILYSNTVQHIIDEYINNHLESKAINDYLSTINNREVINTKSNLDNFEIINNKLGIKYTEEIKHMINNRLISIMERSH